jgi:hypothetical protein
MFYLHVLRAPLKMAQIKRPMILTMLALMLTSLLFGAFIQIPTRRALEHAEALQFRRMLVTQQEEDIFRFFYVTNRKIAETDTSTELQFSNQRSSRLQFGLFNTGIEPSLGIGMLVNPTDWFQNE